MRVLNHSDSRSHQSTEGDPYTRVIRTRQLSTRIQDGSARAFWAGSASAKLCIGTKQRAARHARPRKRLYVVLSKAQKKRRRQEIKYFSPC